jgi:hypothetical protein
MLLQGITQVQQPLVSQTRTRTAVNVLVIEPTLYCVFSSGACPSTELRAPVHTVRPPRTTAATRDGARPSA